jgi:hypothetical protein
MALSTPCAATAKPGRSFGERDSYGSGRTAVRADLRMSTPERADDPGEHGYGGVGVEKDKDRDREDAPRGSDEDEVDGGDDGRHVGGGGRGQGDGVDYPSK